MAAPPTSLALGWTILLLLGVPAHAADDYTATAGSGLTFRAKDVGGLGKLYPAFIPYNSSGVELFTSSNPGEVDPATPANWSIGSTGVAVPARATYMGILSSGNLVGWDGSVKQAAAANLNATVVGTGTFAVQAGQSGVWNVGQTGAWAVTANAGTNLNTSLLALESGGNLATLAGAVSSAVVQSNTKQINGVATSTGTGAVGTGSQRVAVGTDTATIAGSAPGTAGSPSTQVVSVQGVASGTPIPVSLTSTDPCSGAKSSADFSSSTSGGSIIAAVSAKKHYLCSVTIVTSQAANVSLIEGTGASVCTGGTTAAVYLNTGVTASNGAPFGANGGVQAGAGSATIAQSGTANQNLCVAFTTTNSPQVVVHVAYVDQ